jgi:BMFP domain-containing protein YqiC
MQTENRLFEDFVKMANGVAGTFAGMAREGEAGAREKLKGFLGGMDFVSREEFEAVKAMAAAARDEVEALRAEIAALNASAAPKPPAQADNLPPIQD